MPVPSARHKRKYSGADLAINEAESPQADSSTEHVLAGTVVEGEWQVMPDQNGINSMASAYIGTFSQVPFGIEDVFPQHWYITGLTPNTDNAITASDGSFNLTTRRDIGGVAGTQHINRSIGPNTGAPSGEWTGNNGQDDIPVDYIGARGPVGYLDYSAALAQAYAAANRNVYDQAIAEAQLIASQ